MFGHRGATLVIVQSLPRSSGSGRDKTGNGAPLGGHQLGGVTDTAFAETVLLPKTAPPSGRAWQKVDSLLIVKKDFSFEGAGIFFLLTLNSLKLR